MAQERALTCHFSQSSSAPSMDHLSISVQARLGPGDSGAWCADAVHHLLGAPAAEAVQCRAQCCAVWGHWRGCSRQQGEHCIRFTAAESASACERLSRICRGPLELYASMVKAGGLYRGSWKLRCTGINLSQGLHTAPASGRYMADRMQGRNLVYFVVYSLDATRCIILHLAATQSLQHASDRPDCLLCGLAVGAVAILLGQVGAPCITTC